jgi:cadmium resistance transport/sequestration family protein
LLSAVLTGVASFAATNVDDIFLLMLFFSQADGKFCTWHIVAGQYLGFAALVGLSLLGSLGALVIPGEWVGLLGVVPVCLGVRAMLAPRGDRGEGGGPVGVSGAWGVAAVTFANGADNLGVYVPLFAGAGPARTGIIVFVFFVLVALWCFAGHRLGSHPAMAEKIDRYGHVVVPFVLMALGVYILLEAGSPSLLV